MPQTKQREEKARGLERRNRREKGGGEGAWRREIKRGDRVQQETKNKAVIVGGKRENRQWKRMCEKVWKV